MAENHEKIEFRIFLNQNIFKNHSLPTCTSVVVRKTYYYLKSNDSYEYPAAFLVWVPTLRK